MKQTQLALVLLAVGCGGATGLPHGADASSCGTCHASQHAAWSRSRHALSLGSPVFNALLPRVEAAWGRAAKDRCVSCHAPGHGGDESIGCVSCHGAIGNRGEANGALVVNLDAPLGSMTRVVSNDAHAVRPRGLLGSASLCGTCHEVHGPGLFNEHTLTELRASPGADSCITCHEAKSHRFAGVDPAWDGTPAERAEADERARELWASALELELRTTSTGVEVTLTNPGRHAVPTGVAMLRDVWVDLEVRGARRLEATRVIDLRARVLSGEQTVALVTDASRVEEAALLPGASRTFTWTPPPGADGVLEVRAVVKARAFRDDVLHALGLEARVAEVTTLEVAEQRVSLPARR
ncbi:MAG: hypothetical protein JNJ54_01750 [Myxococcaceae bacterium]|nr:hypothetical protein [Myxococcaceae bacterium]